jgi:hypothetical protein
MSFTESEELNKWIHRSYEIGKREERDRIIKLLKEQNVIRNCGATGKLIFVDCNTLEVLYLKDDLTKAETPSEPQECECDPCGDASCSCRKKCDFCVNEYENR